MKKITFIFTLCAFLMANLISAQTVVWSDNLEDSATYGTFGVNDMDADGNNWGLYNTNASSSAAGLTGIYWGSSSYISTGPLTPDNLLFTPTMDIPAAETGIVFKMRVAAWYTPDFAENFTVYVYDNADGANLAAPIHSETLTAGGAETAKMISVDVPAIFAGKTIGFLIRHYDCTNQATFMVDDFEVSYGNALSTEDNSIGKISIYPNSVKEIVTINTNKLINSITIVNQLGQTVKVIQEKEILNNTVNLSNLSSGLYFMSIKVENGSQSFKIIKE